MTDEERKVALAAITGIRPLLADVGRTVGQALVSANQAVRQTRVAVAKEVICTQRMSGIDAEADVLAILEKEDPEAKKVVEAWLERTKHLR